MSEVMTPVLAESFNSAKLRNSCRAQLHGRLEVRNSYYLRPPYSKLEPFPVFLPSSVQP